jgi:hypothetical protein
MYGCILLYSFVGALAMSCNHLTKGFRKPQPSPTPSTLDVHLERGSYFAILREKADNGNQ